MNEWIIRYLKKGKDKPEEIRVYAKSEEDAIKQLPREFRYLVAYPVSFLLINKED